MKEMIKKLQKRSNKKGFTLVEIIVVLVILTILAAIAVPSVLGYINDARDSKYIAEARSIYIVVQTEEARSKAESADGKTLAPDVYTKLSNNGATKGIAAEKAGFNTVTVASVDATSGENAKEKHYKIDWESSDGSTQHAEVYSNKEVKITDN